ncbi:MULTISPECIES: ImmA/IrrE family metallo-endopeptidase [Chelativorans]|jgi:Zn-dependent peptidase ImmA (M78 family)|uniref:IrrE N-terminal-like domain-containing protein n=1 Tax=Chelativorans sp. (strain BNC1) TaxID=266779 RepID=Q11J38_CHESB|nr:MULTISPECIES: ImmA/IrrE family metallo-endopeptidase [Chelativorans]
MIRYEVEDEIIRKYAVVAPVDVKAIIRDIGLTYVERDMPPGESGYIEYDGWTCTIAVNANEGPQRKRFTAAHELGHFLMHRDLLRKQKHLDRLFDEAANRNTAAPLEYWHEVQANNFAARLLMPKQTVEQEIASGNNTIEGLARKFDVSRSAMEYRIKSLRLERQLADDPDRAPAEL